MKSHSIRWVYNRWPSLTNGEIGRLLGCQSGHVNQALFAQTGTESPSRPPELPEAVVEGAPLEVVKAACAPRKPGSAGDAHSKAAKARWIRAHYPRVGVDSIASALRMRSDHVKAALSVDGPELAEELVTDSLRRCAASLPQTRVIAPATASAPAPARPRFGLPEAAAALSISTAEFLAQVKAQFDEQCRRDPFAIAVQGPTQLVLQGCVTKAIDSVRAASAPDAELVPCPPLSISDKGA
jgi:hypothetical protein